MRKRPFPIFLLVLLAADARGDCAPPLPANAGPGWFSEVAERLLPQLDPSRLREWEQSAKLPCQAPFRASFERAGSKLTFLATDHANGPVPLGDRTLSKVREMMSGGDTNALLIELDTGGAVFRPSAIEKMTGGEACRQGERFTCGEGLYAASLAGPRGVAVVGGEQRVQNFYPELGEAFRREDLLAYAGLRAVLSLRRSGVPEDSWETEFGRAVAKDFDVAEREVSFGKLRAWFDEKGLSFKFASAEMLEPLASGTITQRIAAAEDRLREQGIVNATNQLLREKDSVAVVYGFGHFYKQLPALVHAFGEPKYDCGAP